MCKSILIQLSPPTQRPLVKGFFNLGNKKSFSVFVCLGVFLVRKIDLVWFFIHFCLRWQYIYLSARYRDFKDFSDNFNCIIDLFLMCVYASGEMDFYECDSFKKNVSIESLQLVFLRLCLQWLSPTSAD